MNTDPRKILLLGASFGTGNMGVGALTAGALTVAAKRYPEAQVSLLDYGKVASISRFDVDGRTLEIPLINMRFSWKLFLANNVAFLLILAALTRILGEGLRTRLIRRNRWLAAVDDADLALAVSGGDSFSDIYGFGRFFYVTLPQFLVILLGKRLILLPQTIGPFARPVARVLAGWLMRRASLVCTRDADGLNEVRHLLRIDDDDARACFCPDMGFVVEPHAPHSPDLGGLELPSTDRTRPLVGFNVSGLLLMGGYDKSNMFQLNVNYADLVDRLVELFVDEKNANVLLIPHVFGKHEESDTWAIETVYERLRQRHLEHLFCARGTYDQNEIKHIIGRCEFFVGSRMHACIAALSQAIPAIGVAYSDKFSGVFASVGAAELVADPRQLTLEQTLATIAHAFDSRHVAQLNLVRRMPQVKTQVLSLLNKLG